MNKKDKILTYITIALLALLTISLIINTCYLSNICAKLQVRDRTILLLEESKANKDRLFTKYLDKWMEEGYISGKNKHQYDKERANNY